MEMSDEALHLGGTLELSPLYCKTSIGATNNMVIIMLDMLYHVKRSTFQCMTCVSETILLVLDTIMYSVNLFYYLAMYMH